jgi:hypothetical protein
VSVSRSSSRRGRPGGGGEGDVDLGLGGSQPDPLAARLADEDQVYAGRRCLSCQALELRRLTGQHEPAGPLAEERRLAGAAAQLDGLVEVRRDADISRDRALTQRAGQPAVADVVGRGHPPRPDRLADELNRRPHGFHRQRRQTAAELAAQLRQLGSGQRR